MSSSLRASLSSLARRWTTFREERAETAAARRFWSGETAREAEDHYWGAQPLVRCAINRRVTGDPNRWPMEWFRETYARQPFARGLSVGCGAGLLERDVLAKGICEAMEGIDFSEESLEQARFAAEEEHLSDRLEYRAEDINALKLPRTRYDIVFFHGSLHHIRQVERVLTEVRQALMPGGMIYLDEYMGPSRSEWTDEGWGFARSAFDSLPEELKNRPNLMIPLPIDDPSESIRSSAIRPAAARLFEIMEERPYGGNILWFVFPCLDMERLRQDSTGALSRLIALEEHLLEGGWVESYFRVIVAKKS
ncbi:MAG TPA: class I SAM-dependent methyltransferase [Thermoanaerobaculia bacterium]|nr:class I SAM-dependent methyltransferase [Thermoanaerobaculia bacterium]